VLSLGIFGMDLHLPINSQYPSNMHANMYAGLPGRRDIVFQWDLTVKINKIIKK